MGIPLSMAEVASVRRNLCGCTFVKLKRLPRSRSRVSTPPIISRSCGAFNETNSAGFASVRSLSYGTNLWGSADYRRRISAPLAIQAVRRAAGIELSAALARELEGVQIPKFATDEYSCRRVPGVDSSEVR